MNIMSILFLILIIEIWVLFWVYFYSDSFYNTFGKLIFWFLVLFGLIYFYSFGKSSTITLTQNHKED